MGSSTPGVYEPLLDDQGSGGLVPSMMRVQVRVLPYDCEMPSLSSAHDQYGEIDVDPSRYSWALRRAALPILAAAIAAGLAASAVLGSSQTQQVTRLVVQPDQEVLGSTGLDDAFEEMPTAVEANEFITGAALVDTELEATSLVDPAAEDVISLTMIADSPAQADTDTGSIISQLNAWITERRTVAAAPLLQVVDAQSADANSRLDVLDTEIASLNGQDALRDAYLAERSDLNSALRLLDRQRLALQAYGSANDHVEVVGTDSTTRNSRVLWLILGLFLGALLAALAVIVRAHGDRSVRTRSDLRAATGGPVLSVIPSGGPQVIPAQSSLLAAAQRLGSERRALLVPVDGGKPSQNVSVETVANGFEVYSTMTGSPTADGSQAVVVAAWGKTHADDVALTCQNLRAMNCDIVGCVLVDVPEKELRRSMA
jgi:hypothetical protein